ncbi:hypothetical protein cypCar_00047435 [Cyprinus carpio]|nr:hypothetical protein cypCar_00047435 [Cyprinus carpio]
MFFRNMLISSNIFITANLSDPCYNYTVLDEPWRATNNTNDSVRRCEKSVIWSGWYRLFINGLSAHIPDTCVAYGSCGSNIALWIRGGHPTVQDGVVTRDVCGYDGGYCCYYGSYPIKVKACPGNYYVYELVRPTLCYLAYCAGDYIYISTFYTFMIFVSLFINHYSSKFSDVSSINTSSTAVIPATLSTAHIIVISIPFGLGT